jgi:hypothetical protein
MFSALRRSPRCNNPCTNRRVLPAGVQKLIA